MEEERTHVYTSPSWRVRETTKWVMSEKGENYIERVRKELFLSISDPSSADFLSLLKNNRRSGVPEDKFVTDFLRWKWAYFDKNKWISGHPINLAKPFLYKMKWIFDRIASSSDHRINTFVYYRHWAKTWINWELSDLWKEQAKKLWQYLKSDPDVKKAESNPEYHKPIYIAWHNTFFEPVAESLFFWREKSLKLHKKRIWKKWKDIIPKNQEDIFRNFSENKYEKLLKAGDKDKLKEKQKELQKLWKQYKELDYDSYLKGDRQKMLELTEPMKFIFYPPKDWKESYMEVKRRWLTEKFTKTEFDKMMSDLGEEKASATEINEELKLSHYTYDANSHENTVHTPKKTKDIKDVVPENAKLMQEGFTSERWAWRKLDAMKDIDRVISDMESKWIVKVSEKEGWLYCTIKLPWYRETHWFEPDLKEHSDAKYRWTCSYLFWSNSIMKNEVKLSWMIWKKLNKRKNKKLAKYLKKKESEGLIFEWENWDQRLKFINLFSDYITKHYNIKLDDLWKENAFFRAIGSIWLFHSNCWTWNSRNIIQCDEEGCYIFNSSYPDLLWSVLLTDCNI